MKYGNFTKEIIMSRIGKKPIVIPDNVAVKIEGNLIMVKGPKGELSKKIPPEIKIELKDRQIVVLPVLQIKKTDSLWGLTRALIFNLVKGVTEGYEKKLEIEGIGYKALVQGNKLILSLGFSHPVEIEAPEGIKFQVEKNIITVSGPDKELVGRVAANIRAKKKPEPYKGKGIKYFGETVRRKAGKKAVAVEK